MPGVGGTVTDGGGILTGTILPRAQAAAMPPIEVPTLPGPPAPLTNTDTLPVVVPAGDHWFTAMDLRAGSTTIVQGPATVVTENLDLGRDGLLEFDSTNGPIDVYVTGDVELDVAATVVTTVYDPGAVTIQVTSDSSRSVNLKAKSTFYGFVYAPNGDVLIGPQFEIFGGIVAKYFDLTNKGRIHYDTSVAQKLRTLPARVSWRVVDLPAGIAAKGIDPFTLLGLDPDALPTPAEAHADQWLLVQYVDQGGLTRSYAGMESGFDWSGVREVLEMYRDGDAVVAPSEWGEPNDPASTPVDPADALLLDAIADPGTTSAQLLTQLMNDSPGLSDDVMLAAIQRDPAMGDWDLYMVLEKNGPYSPSFTSAAGDGPISDNLLHAVLRDSVLDSKFVGWILEQNSPLSADVLQATIDKTPALKPADLNRVLSAQ